MGKRIERSRFSANDEVVLTNKYEGFSKNHIFVVVDGHKDGKHRILVKDTESGSLRRAPTKYLALLRRRK